MEVGERPEKKEGEVDGEDLEDFRERTLERDSQKPTNSERQPEGAEDAEKPGNENVADSAERLSDEDLEKFRELILEEYGPEGLGEGTPEGQMYNMALEHAERQATADFYAHRHYEGTRIDGAYAVVLDWEANTEKIMLYTMRVVPRQELRRAR